MCVTVSCNGDQWVCVEVGAALRGVLWGWWLRLDFHVNEILDLRQDKDNSDAFSLFSHCL